MEKGYTVPEVWRRARQKLRLLCRQWLPLLVGGLALALYAITAAPWLAWAHEGADGGDLITAAMTWGVPHPPGYPTYCLLGRLYALLPLGNVARRFNLYSATSAAGAVALICALMQRVAVPESSKSHTAIAGASAVACATGYTLWSQAIVAEVYALAALFFAACWLLARWAARPSARPRDWGVLGMFFSLGLGAHLTLVLVLPGISCLLWPRRSRARILALCLGLALGLGVFAYLPLAARGDPPINWGDPDTWSRFWWLVSGRLYHDYAFSLPLASLPARLGAWASLWRQQYGLAGLALALYGLSVWFDEVPRWAWATAITVASYSLYAIGYDTTDSYVYLLPTYLITALWMAVGARAVWCALVALPRHGAAARALFVLALVVLPLILWNSHHEALDLSEDRGARDWVVAVEGLPPDALLITGEDRHTFAMGYAQWVEHRRPDLWVVDGELWAYDWYRAQNHARLCMTTSQGLVSPQSVDELEALVRAALRCGRPVYLGSERAELTREYTTTPEKVFTRLAPRP